MTGADGGPLLDADLARRSAPVGEARVFRGDRIAKAVYVGLAVPQIGLDSHMVFAFSPAGVAGPALHAGLGVRPGAPTPSTST